MNDRHRAIYNPTAASALEHLVASAAEIQPAAQATAARYTALVARIQNLEAAGITNASIYMRDEKYMTLVHPTNPETGARQREYIGSDPIRQEAARARLARWNQHYQLTERAEQLSAAMLRASRLITSVLTELEK